MRTLRLKEVKQLAQGYRIHLEMSSPSTFSEREEMVLLGLQLLKKDILSESQGWLGAQERWLGPQKTSERSGRGFSMPLMRSSGSWDRTEEPGITEVSTLPMVTSLSSCRRCWRISCDKEKLLPSAGSGMRRAMCRGWWRPHTFPLQHTQRTCWGAPPTLPLPPPH